MKECNKKKVRINPKFEEANSKIVRIRSEVLKMFLRLENVTPDRFIHVEILTLEAFNIFLLYIIVRLKAAQ